MCLQNEHGQWPLYVAASHGHLEMVQDLHRVRCTACTGCAVLSSYLLYLLPTCYSCLYLISCVVSSARISPCTSLYCLRNAMHVTLFPLPLTIPCSLTERWPCPLPEHTECQHCSACSRPEWQCGDSSVCLGLHAAVLHCGT